MNQEWQEYFSNYRQKMLNADSYEEMVQHYCIMMNYCLKVQTPLEVFEEMHNLNNWLWAETERRLLMRKAFLDRAAIRYA